MWWHSVVGSLPFLVIIFILLRHMTLERNSWAKEREMLISRLTSHAPKADPAPESFIPFDDPRMKEILEHASSTVGSVEGEDRQP